MTPTRDVGPNSGVDIEGDDGGLQLVREEQGFGVTVKIVAFTSKRLGIDAVEVALENAVAELRHLDGVLSDWNDSGDVARINSNAGAWVGISPSTTEVVSRALWCSRVSQGAFDITFRTISPFWNFDAHAKSPPSLPEPNALATARAKIGYGQVQLNETDNKVQIGADQKIGLGALTRGYTIDKMAGVLDRAGVVSYSIKIGSDHFSRGTQPGGTPWKVEIQDPRLPLGASFAWMELKDAALSTAGDYKHSFNIGGERYHHILDPYTGYPAKASRSVSVWAPTALMADALDDAVFVLGPAQGLRLIDSLEGVGAIVVDGENKVWVSERLKPHLKIERDPTDKP